MHLSVYLARPIGTRCAMGRWVGILVILPSGEFYLKPIFQVSINFHDIERKNLITLTYIFATMIEKNVVRFLTFKGIFKVLKIVKF